MKAYNYYTLTIFRFSRVINSGDIKYLLTEPEKVISLEEQKELAILWDKIFYKFLDEKGDKETKANFEVIIDLLEMEKEYDVIKGAVSLYLMPTNNSEKKRLRTILEDYGQKIEYNKKIQPQIDTIERHLRILETNIRQKKLENADIFKKIRKKVKLDIFKETAALHKILGIKLAPMSTTLPEYIAYLEMAKQTTNERNT